MASGKAILYDTSRCSACKGCQVACKCWNELPSPMEQNSQEWGGSLQCPPDLNKDTCLIITFSEADNGKKYGVNWAFGRRSCMHCTEASCVKVCPTGCLFHDETGMVSFDNDKCIGCQFCRSACPFNVPRHLAVGPFSAQTKMRKCTGCIDRIKNGRPPACVSTCQPGALSFGEWEEMRALGEKRVAYLKAKGFESAQLYGAEQVGGTHVLHVLKYPLEQYELPEDPQVNPLIGALSWMKPVLGVGAAALVGGLGISFIRGMGYERDELRYDEVNHDIIKDETGEVVRHIDKEAGER